jgi:hypothetical protein
MTPFDLPLAEAETIAPAAILLHVARTGKVSNVLLELTLSVAASEEYRYSSGQTISNPTTVATLREPFFGGRLPRTLLCLPLMNRAGVRICCRFTLSTPRLSLTHPKYLLQVVFLSSRSIASEPPTSAQIEAIQCVSAFATIALEASLSQRRLESLVSDRCVLIFGLLSFFLTH